MTDNTEEITPDWSEVIHAVRDRLILITEFDEGPATIWSMDIPIAPEKGEADTESKTIGNDKPLVWLSVTFTHNSFPDMGLYEGEARLSIQTESTQTLSKLSQWTAQRLTGWIYDGDNWRLAGFKLLSIEKMTNGGRLLRFSFAAWTKPVQQILFKYDDTQIILPAPVMKKTQEIESVNVTHLTAAGSVIVQESGISQNLITLYFTGLSEGDWKQLEGFILLTKGNALPFSFTDEKGIKKSVRFALPNVKIEIEGNNWSGTIKMVEEFDL